ncbi:MAG: PaaX family transcriptional regulator C-terminal domain-containing protein [Pseudomonadota bacterium]
MRFQDLRDVLTAGQDLRTWSVLVAVFGDLAPAKGDALSGTALREILRMIGIRPEALRVALHRLRKDDWIESERIGRQSTHRLSAKGRRETARATPLIYATGPRAERTFLYLSPPGRNGIGFAVAPQLALGCERVVPPDVIACAPPQMPDWITALVCPPDLLDATADLSARFSELLINLSRRSQALTAVERAALRVLAVQGWRRVVLKLPALSDDAFPPDWRGAACREGLAAILSSVPRPDIAEIEADARRS